MKKIIFTVLAAALVFGGFASCAKGEYTDGTYKAEYEAFDTRGWKAQVEITVKNGNVKEVDFDYFTKDGKRKSEDEAYAERMASRAEGGMTPAQAKEQLEAALIKKQAAGVDSVTGATHTAEGFNHLVEAVLAQAKAGNTAVAYISQNGAYKVSDEADSRGYIGSIEVVYQDGKIVGVTYDEADADGNKKRENEGYNTMMAEKSGVTWVDAATQLEAALVSTQNVDGIDVVTGATGLTERFKALAKAAIGKR